MRVLFCNITWMKYYKGNTENDRPELGGSYVDETGEAHEDMNFYTRDIEDSVNDYCLGFYETKTSKGGKRNQTRLENIDGCGAYNKEASIDHILVVWCVKSRVVGWYKNATVNRRYLELDLELPDGDIDRIYNISAIAEDCTLLPVETRFDSTWDVPRARRDGFGFGQANVWYPKSTVPEAKGFVEKIIKNINHYNGKNWVSECPEE